MSKSYDVKSEVISIIDKIQEHKENIKKLEKKSVKLASLCTTYDDHINILKLCYNKIYDSKITQDILLSISVKKLLYSNLQNKIKCESQDEIKYQKFEEFIINTYISNYSCWHEIRSEVGFTFDVTYYNLPIYQMNIRFWRDNGSPEWEKEYDLEINSEDIVKNKSGENDKYEIEYLDMIRENISGILDIIDDYSYSYADDHL